MPAAWRAAGRPQRISLTSDAVRRIFPTPQDAEAAFYEALEKNDLEAMMEAWADDEEIFCVHPGGVRLVGYDAVRAAWQRIFASGQRLRVRTSDVVTMTSGMIAVHTLHENIAIAGDRGTAVSLATNIYLRSSDGWRMIAHHASPGEAATPVAGRAVPDGPKTLH